MSWVERWQDLLESSGESASRHRQRAAALQRSGRVSDLRVSPGLLTARVQGSHATPYAPALTAAPLSDAAWETVVDRLAGEVRHGARLLAGQIPEGFEDELSAVGVELFPPRLDSDCACGQELCVHAIAVGQGFADALVDDPFLLLRLRGRGRERMLADLAEARRRGRGGTVRAGVAVSSLDVAALDVAGWTRARTSLADVIIEPGVAAPTAAAALKLLGDPPGWAGGVTAWSLFRGLVEAGAEQARRWTKVAAAPSPEERPDDPRTDEPQTDLRR